MADKFPTLLKFLLKQKRAIEYDTAELRNGSGSPSFRGSSHYFEGGPSPQNKFLLHENATKHTTNECKLYLAKSPEERKKIVQDKIACWCCLKTGHLIRRCRRKKECGINGCKVKHHPSIHIEPANAPSQKESVSGTANACQHGRKQTCLLQIQRVRTTGNWLNIMWDDASSLSFITNTAAKAQKLRGTIIELSLIKVGAEKETIMTRKYKLPLINLQGKQFSIEVYGIDKITSDVEKIDIDGILHLFDIPKKDLERPSGAADVLIGYDYAGFHQQKQKSSEHLLLLRNCFGYCIGGRHPGVGTDVKSEYLKYEDVQVHHVKGVELDDFYNIENLGIECTPRCGGCKCGKCRPGGKNYTLKEERELKLIESNLEYDKQNKVWITSYPWFKDPINLPDNRKAALGKLMATERRLLKNTQHAEKYQRQIEDMVERGVARKLTTREIQDYKGPVH